jgi:hypothetical protein
LKNYSVKIDFLTAGGKSLMMFSNLAAVKMTMDKFSFALSWSLEIEKRKSLSERPRRRKIKMPRRRS